MHWRRRGDRWSPLKGATSATALIPSPDVLDISYLKLTSPLQVIALSLELYCFRISSTQCLLPWADIACLFLN